MRWRKRIGEEGVEWLLTKTIKAGRASGAVSGKSLKRVAVDTTVMAIQVGHYAHARQFKRMRKALRQLKGFTSRVRRDLRRHLQDIPDGPLRGRVLEAKVSLATTLDGGFVVGARSFTGNPYDGHTLAPALEQVAILTDQVPDLAVVDLGYRGHGVKTTKVLISGTRRGITPLLVRLLRRRSAIEPEIGHMKSDGRLARCPLKGRIGDAVFAVLCACGHNIRKILTHLRAFWTQLLNLIVTAIQGERTHHREALTA